ncbi:HU family DNA-binding protein [Photobacterium damselae]|uniref:HU family DNA-binding protein n=1 Tax=Photobacterium damselae TaxID=38293 RepID=UPI000D6682F6|nr:HU family DNA-binding protein [Photobacterium damselae]AWK84508.1 hypothetical protein BST98_20970 [Photobacterium damselae]
MNRKELEEQIAEKSGITKAAAERVLKALIESVQEALAEGDSVQLLGFGTFKVNDRAARTGRNPKTGEPIQIAAAKVPTFTASKTLKEICNS